MPLPLRLQVLWALPALRIPNPALLLPAHSGLLSSRPSGPPPFSLIPFPPLAPSLLSSWRELIEGNSDHSPHPTVSSVIRINPVPSCGPASGALYTHSHRSVFAQALPLGWDVLTPLFCVASFVSPFRSPLRRHLRDLPRHPASMPPHPGLRLKLSLSGGLHSLESLRCLWSLCPGAGQHCRGAVCLCHEDSQPAEQGLAQSRCPSES